MARGVRPGERCGAVVELECAVERIRMSAGASGGNSVRHGWGWLGVP